MAGRGVEVVVAGGLLVVVGVGVGALGTVAGPVFGDKKIVLFFLPKPGAWYELTQAAKMAALNMEDEGNDGIVFQGWLQKRGAQVRGGRQRSGAPPLLWRCQDGLQWCATQNVPFTCAATFQGSMSTSWKQRWFVLTENQLDFELKYYTGADGTGELKGSINVMEILELRDEIQVLFKGLFVFVAHERLAI